MADDPMPLVDSAMDDEHSSAFRDRIHNWLQDIPLRGLSRLVNDPSRLFAYFVRLHKEDGLVPPELVQDGALKPFHSYAEQSIYDPDQDIYTYIASLWLLDPELLPSANIHELNINHHVQSWLAKERMTESRVQDLLLLRDALSSCPRPEEPLFSWIFHGDKLKYFTNPNQERREGEDIYSHIAALWGVVPNPISNETENVQVLEEKMEAPYVGDGVVLFAKGMDRYRELWKTEVGGRAYGRIVAIVAPSGMGKTRLTIEYIRKHPGLYICLRDSNIAASGFPKGDEDITAILKQTDQPLVLVCAAVLGALMEGVLKTYKPELDHDERLAFHHDQWKHQKASGFPSANHRKKNLAKAAQLARDLIVQHRKSFDNTGSATVLERAVKAVELVCAASAKKLANLVPGFVFCVDECTSIGHLCPEGQVSPLLRVMECLSNYNIWFVLASTSSRIVSMVPSLEVTSSQRLAYMHSLPPWFYMPFDPFLEARGSPNTLTEALRIQQFCYFGRPLWTLYKEYHLLQAAKMKLFCGVSFDPEFDAHIFALFTQRICLELSPTQASQLIEVKAVEKHLRMATGIHAGRLITSCPSEPILALAAANAVKETSVLKKATEKLIDLVSKHHMDRGFEGELYSRLVLIMARDSATTGGLYDETNFSLRSVTLNAMLGALLKDEAQGAELNKLLKKKSFGKNIHLTFTHWVELTADIAVVDAQWCFDMLFRATAAQCTFAQPVIDALIVGYEGDLGARLDEKKLRLTCVQDKARVKAAGGDIGRSLTCPAIRYTDGTIGKPEYTALLLDMGTHSKFGHANGPSVQVSHRVAQKPTGKGKNWGGYLANKEPKGVLIEIRGLNAYKVLEDIEAEKITKILYSVTPSGGLDPTFGTDAFHNYKCFTDGRCRFLEHDGGATSEEAQRGVRGGGRGGAQGERGEVREVKARRREVRWALRGRGSSTMEEDAIILIM
ncbi:hypothetical protein GGX14DRAFT_564621 [Mycena pura]|uniref:Uncharacterized protein n=1 Tax=Mycena pura TaxID=153505 RepID=A0AAD6VHF4_9AGAR|nr:hypothetical protein GGX14DRAFT_564621 [Mycena pura]